MCLYICDMENGQIKKLKRADGRILEIYQFYTPKANEQLVLIENFDSEMFKTYAVYVDGEYDRRLNIAKF